MTGEINHELKLANVEHMTRMEKFAALKAQVLDRSLSMELRLRAMMQIDALIWARRQVTADYVGEDDKIATAKKEAERKRLAVQYAERVEAGLPVRSHRHVVGRWTSVEHGDGFGAPPLGVCLHCGRRYDHFARPRSRMCSRTCARRDYEARKKAASAATMVNGQRANDATRPDDTGRRESASAGLLMALKAKEMNAGSQKFFFEKFASAIKYLFA